MPLSAKTWLLLLIAVGALARAYDINAPWKRKDHYNYGGVHLTRMAECLSTMPLEASKGIPHLQCPPESLMVYPNHPPTILFAVNAWKTLWGSQAEWTYRSFVMLFSWLNILLVFLIASRLFPQTLVPYWASAVQSLTLGGLYFGTHPDFINEFAFFFPLLASYLYLTSRLHLAGAVTVVGGLASWPGFLFFAGQAAFLWLARIKKKWPIFLWGLIGVMAGLALMMWLKQTFDLSEFLRHKLAGEGYLTQAEETDPWYFLKWIKTLFRYHSNYLTPVFLFFLLSEIIVKTVNREWNRQWAAIVLLLGGGGFLYVILGERYVYVHAFLYLYLFPLYALLIGRWLQRCLREPTSLNPLTKRPWLVISLTLFVLLAYPYGRLQTNLVHDVINSLLIIGSLVGFVTLMLKQRLTEKSVLILLTIAGVASVSQMVNYRNEPAADFEFCQKARNIYSETQLPVQSPLDKDFTRDFYCRGIPLVEPSP